MKKLKCFFVCLLLLCPAMGIYGSVSFSKSYPYSEEKATLHYQLAFASNDDGPNTVTLYRSSFDTNNQEYVGGQWVRFYADVDIPETVEDNGTTYRVTRIGDEVFKNSSYIGSVVIPNSVTTIGRQAFWYCVNLKTAVLGNSVESIGEIAFQYCKNLESISLPNSLTHVGDHFLCGCGKLAKLVVPENLTNIGEYFLHGCESLRAVYLLGNKQRTLGNYPFMSQEQQRQKQVSGCTFFVDSEDVYNHSYKNSGNWKYADEGNSESLSDDGSYSNTNLGHGRNKYSWAASPDIRKHENRWVTVRYPKAIDAKVLFGNECKVAKLTAAQYKGIHDGSYLYHLDFMLVADCKMEANVPYLLKVDPKNVGSAYIVEHVEGEADIPDAIGAVSVAISNQGEDPSAALTTIKMLGTFATEGHELTPGEYIFANRPDADGRYDTQMKFYKQNTKRSPQRHVGPYRCYWQIEKDGAVCTDSKMGFAFEHTTTGIGTDVKIRPADRYDVYNLLGQLVKAGARSTDGLVPGVYIVNGKKIMVKGRK